MSFSLPNSRDAWGTPAFARTFCHEVAQLPPGTLPLQLALRMGSHVLDNTPKVMLLSSQHDEHLYRVKAGVFFSSVMAGCNCADDPSPVDQHEEYCELQFEIDPTPGETRVGHT